MMQLVALAQVLLVFTIIGAVSVYVLSVMGTMDLSTAADEFITKGQDMYSILGDFGKVVVVIGVVGVLIGMLGIRFGPQG